MSARSWSPAAGVACICLLAFAFRASGFEWVFIGDEVIFLVGDGYYHARLALYDFVNFPSILVWDPYLNYPHGASVPSAPLFDFLVAGAVRLWGGGVSALERTLAWSTPLYGALTPIPVYLATRRLADRPTALGAAAIFAALPIAVANARVGNADHHAGVAFLGAILLALCMTASGRETRGRKLVLVGAGLALARLAMALSWSASLLYLGLAEGTLVLCGALSGRRDLLATQSWSAAATGVCLLPIVLSLPSPVGGDYSPIALSRLHVAVPFTVAAVAGSLWALEGVRPARGALARAVRLVAVTAGLAAVVWVVPETRKGLGEAIGLFSFGDSVLAKVQELRPLFSLPGRPSPRSPAAYYGYFAYLIPLAPLAPLAVALRPATRAPALVLAAWTAVLGTLAIWQNRFGMDFCPPGSVAFALLFSEMGRLAVRRLGVPRPVVAVALAVLVLGFLWNPLRKNLIPRARASAVALAADSFPGDRALATPSGSLVRFLQDVRRLTPDTSGYLEEGGVPEYGVLGVVGLGHPLHYVARRATPADGFLHILDRETFAASQRFFSTRREGEALAIAESLRARYVVTNYRPRIDRRSMEAFLHLADGVGPRRSTGRFRLIHEGPRHGRPLSDVFGKPRPSGVVPFKLFEIVPGALIEARGEPGTPASATVTIRTPVGRRFEYAAQGSVGSDGLARLRVAYPTDTSTPARAVGPYRVQVGEQRHAVRVSETDVREGRTIGPSGGNGAQ